MNKKLFLGMFAAAGMLLATSCSNDELDMVQSGNEAQVTFSLAAEGGIATRAISDGTGAKKLVYAVYNANGELIKTIANTDVNGQIVDNSAFDNGLTENVTITLAKGQQYTVAFWAQNPNCTAYTTTDLKNVTIDYAGLNNDETRDAFFKAETFTVTGNTEIDVVLKRPFAQINVGVTKEDWDAAVASGITIAQSSVVIKNAATSLNLLDGTVSGETEVSYSLANIPSDPAILKVDTDGDGVKEEYNWLSMSYILPAEATTGYAKTTMESLQYTFAPVSGNEIVFANGLNSVPVQRNWRTNILGKLLTGDITFNITIDPVYDGDIIYPEASGAAKELIMTATFGGTYTQTEDLSLEGNGLDVKSDFIYNIEDGKTLTSGSASNYGIRVYSGTTTINGGNGNIMSEGGGIGVSNGAEVIFNSGNLEINTKSTSGRYLFYLEGAGSTLTINDGNFDFNKTQNQKRAYICAMAGTTVYVKGGTFGKASTRSGYTAGIKTEDGEVIITGGTFGFDPTTWVADGYKAVKNGENYVVVPEIVASLANVTDDTTVELTNNVTVSTGTTVQTQNATAAITINGNGNSIISTAKSVDDFTWEGGTIPAMSTILSSADGSTVTVNDLTFGGTMSALMLGHYQNATYNNYNTVLNNVDVINAKVVSFSANVSPAVCIYGTATLKNCNIYGTTLSELDTDPMWPVYDVAAVNYSTTTVDGGKIGSFLFWNQAALIVNENATIENLVILGNMNNSNDNNYIKINAGATVNVIDLSKITNKNKVKITIENGANVGKIVANGTEYPSLDAFKAAL